jgi:hypothetical protein
MIATTSGDCTVVVIEVHFENPLEDSVGSQSTVRLGGMGLNSPLGKD